jgi:hypothetical protein
MPRVEFSGFSPKEGPLFDPGNFVPFPRLKCRQIWHLGRRGGTLPLHDTSQLQDYRKQSPVRSLLNLFGMSGLGAVQLATAKLIAALAVLLSGSSLIPIGGDGDDEILWEVTDVDHLQYTPESMVDFLEVNFPDEDFSDLREAIDDEDVTVTDKPSTHDKTTIAIKSEKYKLWVCALALWHEWWHISHIPPGAAPHKQDPETSVDAPCGACNHLSGLLDNFRRISYLSCEGVVSSTEACDLWKLSLPGVAELYYDCLYEGSLCSDFDGATLDRVLTTELRPCNCN